MVGGKEFLHRLGDGRISGGRDAVQLAAIAGGKHDRLFENPAPAQLASGIQRLLRRKRHALA